MNYIKLPCVNVLFTETANVICTRLLSTDLVQYMTNPHLKGKKKTKFCAI